MKFFCTICLNRDISQTAKVRLGFNVIDEIRELGKNFPPPRVSSEHVLNSRNKKIRVRSLPYTDCITTRTREGVVFARCPVEHVSGSATRRPGHT